MAEYITPNAPIVQVCDIIEERTYKKIIPGIFSSSEVVIRTDSNLKETRVEMIIPNESKIFINGEEYTKKLKKNKTNV